MRKGERSPTPTETVTSGPTSCTAAGGAAGSASVVVGHPMDTLKVRMQTAKGNPSLWSLTTGSKYGGPSTLFRGMAAPLSTACVVNAIIFSSYGWSTRFYDNNVDYSSGQSLKSFVCGSFAGLVQALVICPMEHVKCRLQIQEAASALTTAGGATATATAEMSHPLRTTLHEILGSSGNNGFNISALYRGWWITCWREVPAFGAYFTLYDIFKDIIQDNLNKREATLGHCIMDRAEHEKTTQLDSPPSSLATIDTNDTAITTSADNIQFQQEQQPHEAHTWIASAIAGGTTGALTWVIVYPFDVIKTQIQTAPIDTPKSERTISAVVARLVKEHGRKHLFRGLTVTCLRAFPVNGIIFPVYEYTLLQVHAWGM